MTLPITPERLRAHVVRLAGEIDDRNAFRPAALAAAADYIVGHWRGFGYRVECQEYQAQGVRCANLEVERPGREPATGTPKSSTPRVTPIPRPRVTPIARPREGQEVAEPTRPTVYVTGDVVNLRARPSTNYRVVGQARRGDRAEKLGQSGGWVRLRLEKSGAEGWMLGRYIARGPPVASPVARRPQEPSPAEPATLRSPATAMSDDAIRQAILEQSIARYPGRCPCPYNVDRGGRRCGGRSALCYPSDVPSAAVAAYRQASAAR